MILFLYGRDTFRSRRKLTEIVEAYTRRNASGLNLRAIDCAIADAASLKSAANSSSLFPEKKLFVLEHAFASVTFAQELLGDTTFLTQAKGAVFVFFEEGEPSRKNPLLKFLQANATVQAFDLLSGQRLKSWVQREFAHHNTSADEEAVNLLLREVGGDLWRMSKEIEKLVAFAAGVHVSREVVEKLLWRSSEADIFATIDAVASGNRAAALGHVYAHLQKGDPPLYLLSMISYQFRNILQVKDLIEKGTSVAAIAQRSKLHPYVVKKSSAIAKNFSLGELRGVHEKLFSLDLAVKTGKIGGEAALSSFILEVS